MKRIENDYVEQYDFTERNIPVNWKLRLFLETTGKHQYWYTHKIGRPYNKNEAITWFDYLLPKQIYALQQNLAWLIYDYKNEAYSGHGADYNIFDEIYASCQKYNISPKNIIYITSNMREQEILTKYCKERNYEEIYIFSYPYFEDVAKQHFNMDAIVRKYTSSSNNDEVDLDYYFKTLRKRSLKHMDDDNFFMSLSRVNRYHRTVCTYLLCSDPISKHALISHDSISKHSAEFMMTYDRHLYQDSIQPKKFYRWTKTLPMVIDLHNFNDNWAKPTYKYLETFNRVNFHLVQETLQVNDGTANVFFSEKTFKCIFSMHPFIINAQTYAHRELKNLGYELYDEIFDYSFDYIEDPFTRFRAILKTLQPIVDKLKTMTKEERNRWRFSIWDKMEHNFRHAYNLKGGHLQCEKLIEKIRKDAKIN